jgi:hypothetical protein
VLEKKNQGPSHSGRVRPTYNRVNVLAARSEGPNPSGPANMLPCNHEEEDFREEEGI